MLTGTRNYQGGFDDAPSIKPSRRIAVDWLDCDADEFIRHWLPIFDAQHGIHAPGSLDKYKAVSIETKPVKTIPKKLSRQRQSKRLGEIKNLLKTQSLTVAEITKTLKLSSERTAHKVLTSHSELFQVVSEKRVGKNPHVAVWGLAESNISAQKISS